MGRNFVFSVNGANLICPVRTTDVITTFGQSDPVAPVISERALFRDAMGRSFRVTKMEHTGKATAEISRP